MKSVLKFLLLATLLAGCQGADRAGISARSGLNFGADASICQPLADQIAAAHKAINTCVTHSDCVLTTRVPATGYSCQELGVSRTADQSSLWSALNAFTTAGCNARTPCLMMMSSTDRPCVEGRCINSDQYTF